MSFGTFKHLPGERRKGLAPSFNSSGPVTSTFCASVSPFIQRGEPVTTKRHREKGIVGRELLQGLLLERKTVPRIHTSPLQSFQDPRRRSRKGQRKRALRVPNFGCLRQRPLAPTVGNKTPEPDPPPHCSPSPCGFPSAAPSPHYSNARAPRRTRARDCCSRRSPACGLPQPRPGPAACGRAAHGPLALPAQPPPWHSPWLGA